MEQKPGRVENPVLDQSAKCKKREARRKYFQEHKISIIFKVIGTIIAFLLLVLGILNYCGQPNQPVKYNATPNEQIDKS